MQSYFIICPLVFLAGFVDSIAGGGGLISLPAYYLAGLPAGVAAGTNKLSAAMGTTLAAVTYGRGGRIDRQAGGPAALCALLFSAAGAMVMKLLPDHTVRILVMCCIPVAAAFTLKGPSRRSAKVRTAGQIGLLSAGIGCIIGFYDGLVGPGTGTFLILLFVQLLGMEEVRASGTAKLVNLASNLAALASLGFTGDVRLWLGIPAGLCAMVGAYLGSRLTLRGGAKVVRAAMLLVLALLLAKMLWDLIG